METINTLINLFPYALMGSVLAGIICSFLGVFVVSQRAVFFGASLTQVSIAGVAFAFLHLVNLEGLAGSVFLTKIIGASFLHEFEHTFFSLLFSLIAVLIFSQSYRQRLITRDGLLGIIFVLAIALRIMFIQKSPVAEISEIEAIMKGDILFIGANEFYTMLVVLFIVFLIFGIFSRQLKFVTFDAETALAHGVNSRFWLLFFYLTVGVGISLTTRFVGDVFTFAYLILPSSTGLLLGKKVIHVFIIAVIVGAVIPPISIWLAFILDFSSGPAAVVLSFLVFISVYGIKKFAG
ncbi:MAG TPA: metal ABC transporter permease [Ignavibacteriaceae bacterium]|nr:metal ABC transporter permease [Ignavibacteriaceae bacterium]